jgi:hypothetical protein
MAKSRGARWKVGDRAGVSATGSLWIVTVLEDRGLLGLDGERLYRIERNLGGDLTECELSERYLEPLATARRAVRQVEEQRRARAAGHGRAKRAAK